MAKLYVLDLTQVCEEELERWHDEMDEDSRRRADAVRNPHRRRASIAGDHLARTALAEKSGKAPREIVIYREESGKPYAAEGCFSISHSGECVVCAVSDKAVGVDVERIRPIRLRVAQWYFTEAERGWMQEDELRFWQIWTGKEALCKRTGEGLAGLRNCDTLHPPFGVVLTTTVRDGYAITVAEGKE